MLALVFVLVLVVFSSSEPFTIPISDDPGPAR